MIPIVTEMIVSHENIGVSERSKPVMLLAMEVRP